MIIKESPCSGTTLKLTFMQTNYLQVVNANSSEVNEKNFTGFEANVLYSLTKAINFTYDSYEVAKGQHGKRFPNNSWSGAVGRVHDKKADFALSALSETFERKTVIDFSVPYIKDTRNFFVSVKRATRSSILFLSPFELNVWLAELTSSILVLTLIYICSRSLFRSFTLVFGTSMKQSVNMNKVKLPASLIVISWVIFCTILNIFYGNALKASTSVSSKNSINTLDDVASLLRLGNMKFFTSEHSSFVDDMRKMPSSPYGALFRRVSDIRPNRPTDYHDIYEGRITTSYPRLRMQLRLLKAGYPPSKVRAVPEPLMGVSTAIGFQKNFTCKASFNWVVTALSESGCLQKWQEELMYPVTFQELKDKDASTVVNYIRLHDLESTFGLLFASCCVLLFVIAIELWKKWPQSLRVTKQTKRLTP